VHEGGRLLVQVGELGVPVKMRGALLLLGGRLQAVAERLQDPPDGVVGDLEALCDKGIGEVARRLGGPAQQRHRIAAGVGMHDLVQRLDQSGLLVDERTVTTAQSTQAFGGLDAGGDLAFGLDDSVAAHARCHRDSALASPAEHL